MMEKTMASGDQREGHHQAGENIAADIELPGVSEGFQHGVFLSERMNTKRNAAFPGGNGRVDRQDFSSGKQNERRIGRASGRSGTCGGRRSEEGAKRYGGVGSQRAVERPVMLGTGVRILSTGRTNYRLSDLKLGDGR
jgi:hypothetical protein